MSEVAIGIDLGGTRIKAIAIDKQGNELSQLYLPTNDGDDSVWKNAVAEAVKRLKEKISVDDLIIGISAPGLPDDGNTCIAYMPGRLQGLEKFSWSAYLKQRTWVLNDALSALLAEAKYGAAKNKKHVVMLTLGTGVGGAIMIDGKLYQGAFGKAGHIGHMVINSSDEPDITGMPGSLEDCIGNVTIEKRSGGKFTSTRELLDACRNNDPFANEIWLTSIRHLAIGLATVTNILSPEVIVLGGGISECGDMMFTPLKEFMNKYEWKAGGKGVEIVKARFGDLSGAMGAATFAFEKELEQL
ncbi:MAG TPA: ROK family protein [Chitinophagaceae bacterium]